MIRNLSKRISGERREYAINWMFTYGIMIGVCFLVCLITESKSEGIWNKVIDAFVPTTITFCGMTIIQKPQTLNNSFMSLALHIMIIGLSASYIAYFALSPDEQLCRVRILRTVLIMLVAGCIFFSYRTFVGKGKINIKKQEKSDGKLIRG